MSRLRPIRLLLGGSEMYAPRLAELAQALQASPHNKARELNCGAGVLPATWAS